MVAPGAGSNGRVGGWYVNGGEGELCGRLFPSYRNNVMPGGVINSRFALLRATHGVAAPTKVQVVAHGALVVITFDAIAAGRTKQLRVRVCGGGGGVVSGGGGGGGGGGGRGGGQQALLDVSLQCSGSGKHVEAHWALEKCIRFWPWSSRHGYREL